MSYVSRRNWKNNSTGMGYAKKRNRLSRILLFFVLLFLVFEFITTFIITSYKVESISMEPTIRSEAVVVSTPIIYGAEIPFINKRIPKIKNPVRGDIVIYRSEYYSENAWYVKIIDSVLRFVSLQKKSYGDNTENIIDDYSVKRVIGLPGDTVKISENEAFIKPAGKNNFFSEYEIIQQEYKTISTPKPEMILDKMPLTGNMEKITLGKDEYFLLGDNRSMSNDSYYQGAAKKDTIKARVLFEYVPEIKLLK